MWLKGFEILQTIEHQHLQHDTPKQPDIVTKNTYNKAEGQSMTRKQSLDEVPNIARLDC
jgi:hypothetical protein